MGFESEPGLKYEADNKKMKESFSKDAEAMTDGDGDDVFDIPVPGADKSGGEVGDGFLQNVVKGKAASDASAAEEKASSEEADKLIEGLGEKEKDGGDKKSGVVAKSVLEKAPEKLDTADVAQGEIAKEQREAAEESGDLLREGNDSGSER